MLRDTHTTNREMTMYDFSFPIPIPIPLSAIYMVGICPSQSLACGVVALSRVEGSAHLKPEYPLVIFFPSTRWPILL